MAYSKRTGIYTIPIWASGDTSSGTENEFGARIIDRHIAHNMRSTMFFTQTSASFVLSEGTYTTTYVAGTGAYSVSLSALDAVINNVAVSSITSTVWSGTATSATLYLFANLVETSYTTSSRAYGSWLASSSTSLTPSTNQLLLAKLVIGSGIATLYTTAADVPTKSFYVSVMPGTLIQNGSIPTGKFASGVLQTADYAGGSVGTTALASDCVTVDKLASGAVDTTALASGAVTVSKLGAGSVDTTALGNASITTAKFAAGAYIPMAIATKTTSYIATVNDHFISCSGTLTITLPAATGSGKEYYIKTHASNTVTVSGVASTIDDSATATISSNHGTLHLIDEASGQWSLM